jgi:hypothetical protein
MQEFVLKMRSANVDALGAIRSNRGIEIATKNERTWIKVPFEIYETELRIKQLPVESTFMTDEKENLFLVGGLTPVDILKDLNWQPLYSFLKVELPVSLLPGKLEEKISCNLIPSKNIQPGIALLSGLGTWKYYSETAPSVRLSCLRFAVSEKNEVLIIGNPLPPIPGIEYWKINNVLLPCGYDFEFRMGGIFISEKLNASNDSFLLFDKEGRIQLINKTLFVPGKRSAARLTSENAVPQND